MSSTITRLLGTMLIVAAIIGMVFSAAGIVALWRVHARALDALLDVTDIVQATLQATSDGLRVADASLARAADSVAALEVATDSVATTLDETVPLTRGASELVGDELPASIDAMQASLGAAESGARVMDDTLAILSSIPFYPGEPYDPETSLGDGLAATAESMDGVKRSLVDMQASLDQVGDNLGAMEKTVQELAAAVGGIEQPMGDARAVVGQYEDVVDALVVQVATLAAALPRWIDLIAWFLSGVLVWLGFTQVGLLLQGLEWTRGTHDPRPKIGEGSG